MTSPKRGRYSSPRVVAVHGESQDQRILRHQYSAALALPDHASYNKRRMAGPGTRNADNTRQSLAVRLQQQIGLRKSRTDLTEGLDTGSDQITTQAWLDSVTRPSGLPLPKHPSLLQGFGFIPSQCPPQRLAGRTQYHMDNWKKVTQDPWVLHIAEGYELEFESPPYQSCQPVTRASGNQAALIQEEVNALVKKEAIIRIPTEEAREGFFSTLFLVPKTRGPVQASYHLASSEQVPSVPPF